MVTIERAIQVIFGHLQNPEAPQASGATGSFRSQASGQHMPKIPLSKAKEKLIAEGLHPVSANFLADGLQHLMLVEISRFIMLKTTQGNVVAGFSFARDVRWSDEHYLGVNIAGPALDLRQQHAFLHEVKDKFLKGLGATLPSMAAAQSRGHGNTPYLPYQPQGR